MNFPNAVPNSTFLFHFDVGAAMGDSDGIDVGATGADEVTTKVGGNMGDALASNTDTNRTNHIPHSFHVQGQCTAKNHGA
jgi:hypothetical protein